MAYKIRSIAFCCNSTGEYRFPNEEAAEIALTPVNDFLLRHHDAFDGIVFNVFKDTDYRIYEEILRR